MDIRQFQTRYALSNKDMAEVCQCSLPTIQKWRSGEVNPSGAAQQLLKFLDFYAEGNPAKFREILSKISRKIGSESSKADAEIEQLESSMTKVMNRLELMLEARRQEKALAESEARYRSIVDSQEDPVCRWKPDTTLTFVNEAYAELYSKFGSDLIGRKWLEFIPPEKRSFIETVVSDMVRRGQPEVLKHESIDKDGRIHYQEWQDIPILNERGDVMEFHSVGRDKTESVTAQRNVDKLKATVDCLMAAWRQPVMIFKADGYIWQMNECFKEQMLKKNRWKFLGDLFPALEKKRFNRLLERLTGSDQMLYRVQIDDRPMLMMTRSIHASADDILYLGVFEEIEELPTSQLKQVRLAEEVVIDDCVVETGLCKSDEKAIKNEIETIANLTRVDRIYVFTFDDTNEIFNNTFEWCADGVKPQIQDLQRIPYSGYEWWINRLRKGQLINIEDTGNMPRTAVNVQNVLQAQGIASVVVAPLEIGEKVVGFVGFDQNLRARLWHSQELDLLKQLKEKIEEHLAKSLGTEA
jgi:PAS domain S-box-containing protein